MTLEELKKQLQLTLLPPCFADIYEEIKDTYKDRGTIILSEAYITNTLDECAVLTDYRHIILKAAAQIRDNPALILFVCLLERWIRSGMDADFKKYESPKGIGLAYDFLHLFAAIPTIPASIRCMRTRGVPEHIIAATLKEYDFCVRMREISQGRPMFDQGRLDWMRRIISNRLIRIGRFKFDLPAKRITDIRVYKNALGKLCVLADGMQVHRSGSILGAEGLTDPEGSFHAFIRETENTVSGHPILNGSVSTETICLSKAHWTLCLSKDDPVVAVHIPPWEPFDPKAMEDSYQQARRIFKECYPDYPFQAFWCRSWLMSLHLKKILKPDSNILRFQEHYTHYPCESPGLGIFYNVFPKQGRPENLNTLIAKTSLQRGVKDTYLKGGYIHDYCGFFF